MADKISKVKETTSYDNYVGKKETIKPHSLPIEEETLNMNVKENHWVGMPEFEQENNPTTQRKENSGTKFMDIIRKRICS